MPSPILKVQHCKKRVYVSVRGASVDRPPPAHPYPTHHATCCAQREARTCTATNDRPAYLEMPCAGNRIAFVQLPGPSLREKKFEGPRLFRFLFLKFRPICKQIGFAHGNARQRGMDESSTGDVS